MSMMKGQTYRCTEEDCGCEVSVTKGSSSPEADANPLCCCGCEMEKVAQGGQRRSADRGEGRQQNQGR